MAELKKRLLILFSLIAVLTLFSFLVFFKILKNEKVINEEGVKRYRSYLLADELRQSSDDLTRMARTYVVTGEIRFRDYFQKILDIRDGKIPRPLKYHRIYWDFVVATDQKPQKETESIALKTLMKQTNFSEREFNLLKEAEVQSNDLVNLEKQAMNAMRGLYLDEKGHYTQKRPPNQKFAMKLLYGKKYHEAKKKIMKPLEEFFDSIDRRTGESVAFYQAKGDRLSLVLGITMTFSLLLVFIALFLVMGSLEKETNEEENRGLYGLLEKNLWTNWPFVLSSLVVVFLIISSSWWFFMEAKALSRKNLKRNMTYDINTTYNSISFWIDQMNLETAYLAEMVSRIIKDDKFSVKNSRFIHRKLKERGVLPSQMFNDYILTDSELSVVSSNRSELMGGKRFEVPEKVLKRVKNFPYWDTSIPNGDQSHPLIEENILFASTVGGGGFLFLLASPKQYLAPIFTRSFSGDTGEVYMVNSKGQFVSEVRWVDELIEREWLKLGQNSIMGLPVSQTWGKEDSPLVQSVSQVIRGEDASDIGEYRNYLGNWVLGLWRWNNKYQFGIISEISKKEANSFLKFYKHQVFVVTFITVVLILILTFLFIWNRLKVTKINRELSGSYETIKNQNSLLARDLLIGQKVQMEMLPDIIKSREFQIDAYLNPARGVSGDFYDFSFLRNNERLYFCVGDVSGKGVAAALFMSTVKASLYKSLDPNKGSSDLVDLVNRELVRNNPSCMFVTLVVGFLDIQKGKVFLTNAGHNPPYIKKENGDLILLDQVDGPLVGAFHSASFKEQSIDLSSGDSLILYTDGVTEAQNIDKEFYGDDRFEELLKNQNFPSPRHIVSEISKSVIDFIGSAEQSDDITILSLKYQPTTSTKSK